MNNIKIYCVTDKEVPFLDNLTYEIGWVGKTEAPKNYIKCNKKDNIFFKEKYYSELTFHYWYWKNLQELNAKEDWVGFCQKRRFWANTRTNNIKNHDISSSNLFLSEAPSSWKNYDSIICDPIDLTNVNMIKIFKRGFKSVICDPLILFDKNRRTIKLHFDMHHGFGNLSKAANLLEKEDRDDFIEYINVSTSFHPHIMFIAKPNIVNLWFSALFPWLNRCEKLFGFENLKGYDTQRLYAYLAERYLSFWFKKHTKSLSYPWIFFDTLSNKLNEK
jgi:hypothetical protein